MPTARKAGSIGKYRRHEGRNPRNGAKLVRVAGMDLGASHTFQCTIDISLQPKKKKTKPARKPKVKKPPKPRVRISPEERAQHQRAYEQARSHLPHRKERNRVEAKERRRQARELGLCRN